MTNPLHTPAHKAALDVVLQEQVVAEYEVAEGRALQALEDRWIDGGCSNGWADRHCGEEHPDHGGPSW